MQRIDSLRLLNKIYCAVILVILVLNYCYIKLSLFQRTNNLELSFFLVVTIIAISFFSFICSIYHEKKFIYKKIHTFFMILFLIYFSVSEIFGYKLSYFNIHDLISLILETSIAIIFFFYLSSAFFSIFKKIINTRFFIKIIDISISIVPIFIFLRLPLLLCDCSCTF